MRPRTGVRKRICCDTRLCSVEWVASALRSSGNDVSETIEIPKVDEPTLILEIDQMYVEGSSIDQVYESTRGHWRISQSTRNSATLVLGVADGIVRGAYRPSRWSRFPSDGGEGRWGFEGSIAPEAMRIVGTHIGRLPARRDSANPVQFYPGGLPDGGRERSAPVIEWAPEPGDYLGRKERMALYGGGSMGGIQPSALTPNVFLYCDPTVVRNYGYDFDGWNADNSIFLYTGMGQIGDQEMKSGNRSILDHAREGRALRLFIADGFEPGSRSKRNEYIGQFAVDLEIPYEIVNAPDAKKEPRSVFVFRLRPVGQVLVSERDRSSTRIVEGDEIATVDVDTDNLLAHVQEVAIEVLRSRESAHEVAARIGTIERREAVLVLRLEGALRAKGHRVQRHQIYPAGQANPIYTDIFDSTDKILYEAKSDSTRESIRMAIGQLLDYRRFVPPDTRLAVLVPTRPARDLLRLLQSVNIVLCVPSADGHFSYSS